jgi:predicted ATPase
VSASKGLYGRAAEEAAVAAVLEGARAGCGGVLVLRGEAGIGKTALLDRTARSAADMTVLRATAIETEAELPFAGLHLLLRPVLGDLAAIPGPRARALERVLGLVDWPAQPADDVFLAGLAVLGILTKVAERGPVLCLVDDAHWLDAGSATALLFAARRLDQAGVAMVLAVRDRPDALDTAGLPELHLGPLDQEAAREMLAAEARDLDPLLAGRVLGDAGGNPLAIAELARAAGNASGLSSDGPLHAGRNPHAAAHRRGRGHRRPWPRAGRGARA